MIIKLGRRLFLYLVAYVMMLDEANFTSAPLKTLYSNVQEKKREKVYFSKLASLFSNGGAIHRLVDHTRDPRRKAPNSLPPSW